MARRFLLTFSAAGMSIMVLLLMVGGVWRSNLALAAPNQADTPTTREIVVSGTGSVTTKPDQAKITIGVQITAKTLAEATQQATADMTKVLDAIKKQGVDDKEIQTSTYSVNPITNYKEGQTPQVTGYQVMNVVTVTVKNLDNVGKVLDAGMNAGANYLGGIQFGVQDSSTFETDARTAAVKNAMHRAQTLADAAGVKLGRVLSIAEATSAPPIPYTNARVLAAESAPGPVQTGSLEISVDVVVHFEIAD